MEVAMDYLTVALLGLVGLMVLWSVLKSGKRDPRYPPGPRPLPLIGNLHQIGKCFNTTFIKWAKEYGQVFMIRQGLDETVCVNDHKIIKDLFSEANSSGRPDNPIFRAFADGNHGLICAEGACWEQQRRFTLRTLRDFGFAKSSMEGMIMEEGKFTFNGGINSMLNYIKKRADKPTPSNKIFNGAVVNSLWNIISGEREQWDAANQPEIIKRAGQVIDATNQIFKTGLFFMPSMRFILPGYSGWSNYVKRVAQLKSLCVKSGEEHEANLKAECPKDFIDHYLLEMQNEKDPTSSFYGGSGEMNFKANIGDLFLGGSDTTSHTLSWTLLFLANSPEAQRNLQNELDTVVGRDRPPSLADKPNLPYVEATIMEVLRRSSVLPNAIPHRMTEDTICGNFFFPKKSTIFANLWYVNNNPEVWGDPENFRPERFLSPDGKRVVKHEAFLPFSYGKRQCPGKSLAEDTLFLFTSSIFQMYTVERDPSGEGQDPKDVAPSSEIVNSPKPFKVVFKLRTEGGVKN